MEKFDIVVVGGGPGGYTAAIRAAQLGMKTALIEKSHLGGICLNWGCIPTKALLRTAEINHLLHNLEPYGFSVKDIKFDFNKIISRSRDVAKKLSLGIQHLMKKNKITVYDGHGKLLGQNKIVIENDNKQEIEAKHIILATGARARNIDGFECDGKLILSYKEAMTLDKLPSSILVVGSGAIGVEFASFYHNLGSKVTIVEVLDRILPAEDKEISEFAKKSFTKQGITIHTKINLKEFKKGKDNVTVMIELEGKKIEIIVDKVIMATGIVGNTENLGLEKTKIKVEKTHITTNEWLETNEPFIYAIGDIAGAPWLAHKASHEAVLCVEKIAGIKNLHPMKRDNIPGCTYCYPQIASVGLTEDQALEKGYKIRIGRYPFIANGKAIAMGETEGLVKTIFDEKTGELLGAHMIGSEVTEMIQGFVIGKTMEATEEDFMHSIFPHPTLSEMMHESVLDAYKKAINI
jgi:dihydrolipoamide dehydrogenase